MPSRVIHGMLYSPERRTLDIVFRDERGTYRYYDVAPEAWRAFVRAPSKGAYLNAVFKGRHLRFEPLGDVRTPLAVPLVANAMRAGRDVPDVNVWGFYEDAVI